MLKYALIFFAMFSLIERILEILNHRRLQGIIKAHWTTFFMIIAHLGFFIGSLIEFVIRVKNVNEIISAAGLAIFLAGFFLRKWAIRELGPFWSINIEMRSSHVLVTKGPYVFCRHPNYLAILLELIGFCLVFNAFYTLIFSAAIYVLILLARIKIEEKELIGKFDNGYKSYCKETPLLFPRLRPTRKDQEV